MHILCSLPQLCKSKVQLLPPGGRYLTTATITHTGNFEFLNKTDILSFFCHIIDDYDICIIHVNTDQFWRPKCLSIVVNMIFLI